MVTRKLLGVSAVAVLVSVLNAIKPLTIDDPVYHRYAVHFSENPCDPYGFELNKHEPAMQVLAPPVLLYAWAGAIRLLGDTVWQCKLLVLMPFSLALALALHDLFRRFCPGLEGRLTAVTLLSPALLPSWNFMLDLPALALALSAITLFHRAVERASWGLAAGAGLIAGVAMQTKYSAFAAPVVMLWLGCLRRDWGRGLVAAGLAAVVFAAWEIWLVHVYGVSHFAYAAGAQAQPLLHKARLLLPLISNLGGVAPWLLLLALAALGMRRGTVLASLAVVGAFLLIALVPERYQLLRIDPAGRSAGLPLPNLLFGMLGAALAWALGVTWWRLWMQRRMNPDLSTREDLPSGPGIVPEPMRWEYQSATTFLCGWLFLEFVGYFVLSPFPAVRRVLALQVVATLLVGRSAVTATGGTGTRPILGWGLALGIVLGFGYWFVDFHEAAVDRLSAERAARWIQRQPSGAGIRFTGEFGFCFHAERMGMHAVEDDHPPAADWIVVAPSDDPLPEYVAGRACHELVFSDRLPLRTKVAFYAGGKPIEHLGGPRAVVRIYAPVRVALLERPEPRGNLSSAEAQASR
jgi:hypothetical protein